MVCCSFFGESPRLCDETSRLLSGVPCQTRSSLRSHHRSLRSLRGIRVDTGTRPLTLPFRFGLPERPSPGHRLLVGGCVGLSAAGGRGLVHGVLSVVASTPKPQDALWHCDGSDCTCARDRLQYIWPVPVLAWVLLYER